MFIFGKNGVGEARVCSGKLFYILMIMMVSYLENRKIIVLRKTGGVKLKAWLFENYCSAC